MDPQQLEIPHALHLALPCMHRPFIGKIKEIKQSTSDPEEVELSVSWFYRPEEAVGGRKVGARLLSKVGCQQQHRQLIQQLSG